MKNQNALQRLVLPLLGLFAVTTLISCGPGSYKIGTIPEETVKAADGVKWISASIPQGDSKATYGQRVYPISTSQRLLVRYEGLLGIAENISTAKPIYLRVVLPDATMLPQAKTALSVCPLNRNWSMLASWKFAAPFPGEQWTEGGDIETSDCVSADTTKLVADIPGCQDSDAICFDMSRWFRTYLIEKGVDFGVALVNFQTGVSIPVYGDGSNSKGPRFHWTLK